MKARILKILKDNMHKYISGEQISSSLGISRTSVWKHISALREEGYVIESSSKKGYKLIALSGSIVPEEIRMRLSSQFFGKNILYYDTVASTNTIAKKEAAEGCEEGTIVIAEGQTSGRGRLGRKWVSPPRSGIWMSIILRPDILPEQAPFMTMLASLATVHAIENVAGVHAGIKWPNDIVLESKKVCGILTEMSAEIGHVNYIVVGIGINVNINKSDFSEEIKGMATSLSSVTGRDIDRNELIVKLLENFEQAYMKMRDKDARKMMINEYKGYCVTLGRRVKVNLKEEVIEGTAVDVADDGQLVVRTDDGIKHRILSGEVSVRGLYGYV
ncbi:MAG: biotin--[acetyl-CoA-carboxylase] ligase [Clostridiaceae bacterium]|nr:biotin--[acetyl-CoA-carboxylase] ligase [Clostridiaceae bacterium]